MHALIVDCHPLTRMGTKLFLAEFDPALAVDEAAGLTQALQLLRAFRYDLVLLEPVLPDRSEDVVAKVTAAGEGTPVVVLSGSEDPDAIRKAMAAGARAYLSKATSLVDQRAVLMTLVRPVEQAAASAIRVGLPAAAQNNGSASHAAGPVLAVGTLSPRQRAVLPLLAAGMTNKEIARALNLQENTVKLHVREVLRRLKARNRTEAAITAQALLASAPPPDGGNSADRSQMPEGD